MSDAGNVHTAIVGVGLIGGSIARAAQEKGAAVEVVLFDGNPDALKRAGEIGFGRTVATIEEAVKKLAVSLQGAGSSIRREFVAIA